MTDNCTKCGGELNDETWYPSRRKKHDYTCKKCERRGEHIMANEMKILRALIRRYGAITVRTALIEARRRDA